MPIKVLFVRQSRAGYLLLTLTLLSCTLLAVDTRTPLLTPARLVIMTAISPLHYISSLPERVGTTVIQAFTSRNQLIRDYEALKREQLRLQGRLIRFESIIDENERLRQLLNSSVRVHGEVTAVGLLTISTPLEMVIDKGWLGKISVGQAVIDSTGLLGQVVTTGASISRVLLITNKANSVPVQVRRNNVHAIAVGDGKDGLLLKDVAVTQDIRQGDELVSSGLGQRFPSGYPVGVVDSVLRDRTKPFAEIAVRPSAALDRLHHVLVVAADRFVNPGARSMAAAPEAAPKTASDPATEALERPAPQTGGLEN